MRTVPVDRVKSFLRRTEGKLTLFAAATAVAAIAVGGIGWAAVTERQGRLDEAVARQGELTSAALDVYRGLADADAASLNAVLVDPERSAPVRARFREDIFDAGDALRTAAARSVDPAPSQQIQELTDLLPEYARLVETGWTNLRAGHPVGTSYLAQASNLVRTRILPIAEALRGQQTSALVDAQRAAGSTPWVTLGTGAATLIVLVAAQRFVTRRTRRRVNRGLAVATVLVAGALVWLTVDVHIAGVRGADGARELEDLTAPLAQARKLGREADGAEARILIFPKVGDIGSLDRALRSIEDDIVKAGTATGPEQVEPALTALRSWREHDLALLNRATPSAQQKPPVFQELAVMITEPPAGASETHAQQLDTLLTTLIDTHTSRSKASTHSAREALADLDIYFPATMLAAAAASVWGLRRRIVEYYR
ncbi:secreted protein [Alloactinosynnema sp. L-07]|uniref:hypothetical protein n=1 Tax=Alloactinosynnema sp. L-07 TaxID=1653480 RepID=UPI00065EFCC3|nr:hypothetical protein [Alloactinosynnema sp. L-07]CRK55127.1 secreted protein [Alloactinosynnema sp. L-07]